MPLTWDQVFTWRLRRQFVEPQAKSVTEIVRRLCGVQAQVTSAAEMAVALRSAAPESGALVRELHDGTLIKTWAMRGTLHALTPELATAYLSLLASTRVWEKPVWQRNFGASPEDVAALGVEVRRVLDGKALTRDELVDAIIADPAFDRLGEQLRSGWGALLKPLAWQGFLCHGPAQGTKVTFADPAQLITGWPGLPEPDAAAPLAIRSYLSAYGPSTPEAFDAWLSRGSVRKPVLRRWFSELGDDLTEVEVEGRRGYLCTEHVDELAATKPAKSVHLLGGFDQYVLGPGTADTALLPGDHRAKVSRTAGWISPIVVAGGRIVGTWELDEDAVVVSMFDDAPLPKKGLGTAVDQLGAALGREALTVR
ncbi:winged helix DNA-binding domain-containing protein [Nocardia altamirensis]|uniref:winged helix DNA-binding domain-containing protein n=1 Tax=Nocardia altamirensis TaxID=472158 RepID=UPI0008403C32|nr:winged helix DNA-binding domain-containing protein [Nocardia altamirensis]